MNHPPSSPGETRNQHLCAEFDLLADEYHEQHKTNVAITGEKPEYFAEYKIADLAALVRERGLATGRILDLGSGIGNSVPFFRKYFAKSHLSCCDVSSRSIEICQTRFPWNEKYFLVNHKNPLPTHSQGMVFSACIFHHIPHEKHLHWLTELRRVTRPEGLLVIFEHNPLNPIMVRAVKIFPFDVNASLVPVRAIRRCSALADWRDVRVDYRIFFPSCLKFLRPLERSLGKLGLGAQYRVSARNPA